MSFCGSWKHFVPYFDMNVLKGAFIGHCTGSSEFKLTAKLSSCTTGNHRTSTHINVPIVPKLFSINDLSFLSHNLDSILK